MTTKTESSLREEIIMRLCTICALVRSEMFPKEPADCFCHMRKNASFYFSPDVIEFVEDAVREKIERETR